MGHVFISNGKALPSRLRVAVGSLPALQPERVGHGEVSGKTVWLLRSGLDDWQAVLASLVAQGATVAVLSYAPTVEEALQALGAGARGYAHALSTPDLIKQVDTVMRHGGVWVPHELLARVMGGSYKALGGENQVDHHQLACLTERERAVAMAVARGRTNKEVARELGITERTVKAHLGAAFRKLEVRDRLQLILKLTGRVHSTDQAIS